MAIIDGRSIARRRQENLRREVANLASKWIVPAIAPILVGENSAARVYYRAKARLAKKLGIRFSGIELPEGTREQELLDVIDALNIDLQVDGIPVELPLSSHISRTKIVLAISPGKDIDGSILWVWASCLWREQVRLATVSYVNNRTSFFRQRPRQ